MDLSQENLKTLCYLAQQTWCFQRKPTAFLGGQTAGRRAIEGWYSGTSIDAQDTLSFNALSGVHSMNEIYPLERAPEAYQHVMSGKVRFRVVLSMES